MTIHIGWWIIPLLITVSAFIAAIIPVGNEGGYSGIGSGMVGCFFLALAAVVSLVAWLVWALL